MGKGTKIYGEKDIVRLIYDIEENAPFEQMYDSINLISGF